MEKRVEAGWFQRLAWSVLAVLSFGMLVWLPFLYVAIRRGRVANWGLFASFVLYEAVTLWWATIESDKAATAFGLTVLATLVTAVWLLMGPLFDKPTPRSAMVGMGPNPAPWPAQTPGNPYMR
ncbi:hypothetical protein [Streptomyces sp. NPDC086182]|jgi:hypothetical protein|uniref:hypothetical protein n=1 Tax=Streptomyces sp. NPDC086182 TaxID=3155058 RepID=UPI003419B7A2